MISLNKEKNLVDDYVVFDLETTGFDPKTAKIIEIGALKYRNNELIEEFSVLINPKCPIPDVITAITGIDDELVSNAIFIEENINNLHLPMITNKNIDTVYLARKYIKGVFNHKLETLKNYFHLTYSSHRSIEDCLTTNHVYQYCKNKATVKN